MEGGGGRRLPTKATWIFLVSVSLVCIGSLFFFKPEKRVHYITKEVLQYMNTNNHDGGDQCHSNLIPVSCSVCPSTSDSKSETVSLTKSPSISNNNANLLILTSSPSPCTTMNNVTTALYTTSITNPLPDSDYGKKKKTQQKTQKPYLSPS